MIDRDELQRAWTLNLTLGQIARQFHTTRSSIAGMIRRARKADGVQRWPSRRSPIRAAVEPRPPSRVKAGASTLPPLPSLNQ